MVGAKGENKKQQHNREELPCVGMHVIRGAEMTDDTTDTTHD
jgi:hypothetical protein